MGGRDDTDSGVGEAREKQKKLKRGGEKATEET